MRAPALVDEVEEIEEADHEKGSYHHLEVWILLRAGALDGAEENEQVARQQRICPPKVVR